MITELTSKQRANRKYALSAKGRASNRRYDHSKKGQANQIRRRKRDVEKLKARTAVSNAIKSGKLPPPTSLNCHFCSKQAGQYHHENYSKPLDVTPVCIACHNILTFTVGRFLTDETTAGRVLSGILCRTTPN